MNLPPPFFMDSRLKKNDTEIIEDFFSMENRKDVCNFLEIDEKVLIYLLYRKKNYTEFKIKKKSGGFRTIKAPSSTIKIIQRKLSGALYICTKIHGSAHGFAYDKNVKTNASFHVKRRYVLNIDLENFFDTINFGRVMGLFMAQPFNFNKTVAVLLAQICCDNGSLPQGAPTSPIISNLICYRLDNQLRDFSRGNYCTYTRYADDMTISFNSNLALKAVTGNKDSSMLSPALKAIIEENNGFVINVAKVKLYCKDTSRQRVTGLVVNEKVNIKREYIRGIRAILYSWKTKGLEYASTVFFQNNLDMYYSEEHKTGKFIEIIGGRLNYVEQIIGKNNFIYRRLKNGFNEVLNNGLPVLPVSYDEEVKMATWVIENDEFQGTGFFMKNQDDILFVTCAHTLMSRDGERILDSIIYSPFRNISRKYKIQVKVINTSYDFALCEIIRIPGKEVWPLNMGCSSDLQETTDIIITGYPSYSIGQQLRIAPAKVTRRGMNCGVELVCTNGDIEEGNSGGAILNMKHEVVGLGSHNKTCLLKESAFLPIETVSII